MTVSKQPELGIDEILTTDEQENLGKPERVTRIPEAEVVEWEDGTAVATPGYSIAASMDRFLAGNLGDLQQKALEGFHGEFADGRNKVVYADEDVRDILGDQAVARIQGIGKTFPVDVRPPEDALEVVRRYDQDYTGDVEREFWDRINANNAVVPVIYDMGGVMPKTGIALMESEGMIAREDSISSEELLDNDLESQEIDDGLQIERYEAPEESDAEYFVEVLLPPGSDNLDYDTFTNGLAVSADGQTEMHNLPGNYDIIDHSENNGLYRFELQ